VKALSVTGSPELASAAHHITAQNTKGRRDTGKAGRAIIKTTASGNTISKKEITRSLHSPSIGYNIGPK
jgi:hypothetical protein